ncbi:Cytochrome c oxidase subunit CcoO [Labilithrix luteola]|uniref:Cytochrome c oxidase subunit CcoO n=1 Tax=Labilithrix luteola TaxID=1391654 RepID=A0A0K1PZG2_9BACT|nr:cbb3-type cytochrome c oxidase subunit II [Labilithrix luteola]AKU98544.1 Cytochrome c oxidase subunit CcoO [Labilithrix luteola]
MNRLSVIVFGSVGVLILTAMILVVMPYVQFMVVQPEEGLAPYTTEQQRGRDVYVSLGCVYCHTQQPTDRAFAPDSERGWGRPSTPGDYVYDHPHQLGTMRTGPDLFNIGARQSSAGWHYTHLYNPRAVVPGSIMPAYPFLFEVKRELGPDDVRVDLPPELAPKEGFVVAKRDAAALIAYLVSLDHTYPSRYLKYTSEQANLNSGAPR